MVPNRAARWLCALTAALACGGAGHAQQADYVVGPNDVLGITVWNQLDLSGKFIVESDGTFIFPLVGRMAAAGLSVRTITENLKKRLADGYFQNPEISVAVEDYQSQRIFIVGEVRQPGGFPLKGRMTLVEALALAGSTSPDAAQIIVVRKPRGEPARAGADDEANSEGLIHLNLSALQAGDASQNIELHDGDMIFVPRPQTVFVAGQVRNPGAYPVSPTTTVLQVIALAGGVTDRGASNRVKVIQLIDGKREQRSIKLTDIVTPGDTIVVPERFF